MLEDSPGSEASRAEKRNRKKYEKKKEKRKEQRSDPDAVASKPLCVPYEVQISPEKGLGVFALQDITRGTLIFKEAPIIKLAKDTDSGSVVKLLMALSPKKRGVLLDLSSRQHKTAQTPRIEFEQYLLDIHQTNFMSSTEGYNAIWPTASRINHDCSPNSVASCNKNDEALLYASRDIAVGEEITVAYIDVCCEFQKREAALATYRIHIRCLCKRCRLPRDAIENTFQESANGVRANINRSMAILKSCASFARDRSDRRMYPTVARCLIQWMGQEKLCGVEMAQAHCIIATAGKALGFKLAALEHKQKELEILQVCYGSGSWRVRQCETELKELK